MCPLLREVVGHGSARAQDPAYASVGPRAEPQARGNLEEVRRANEADGASRRLMGEDGKGRVGAGERGDGERMALGGVGGTLEKDRG